MSMSFPELLKATGWSQQKFGDYFGIPRRTVQSWWLGDRACPSYLLALMLFKLQADGIIKDAPPE